jgi:hypothetical protein
LVSISSGHGHLKASAIILTKPDSTDLLAAPREELGLESYQGTS